MDRGNCVRFDRIAQPGGGVAAAWGFQVKRGDGFSVEYLMFAHTIPEDGVFIAEGMTHELTLHILAPTVPIDFERDLFQQPALAPVVPAIYGFQWDANACDWLDTGSGGVTELLRTAGASFELETLDEYTDKVVTGKAPLYREEELLAAE